MPRPRPQRPPKAQRLPKGWEWAGTLWGDQPAPAKPKPDEEERLRDCGD